jgi:serine/threonine protein kinase
LNQDALMSLSSEQLLRSPLFAAYENPIWVSQGGQGFVYKVREKASGEPRALKLARLSDSLDDQRWRREAEALRRLNHPSIVRLYDSGAYENWRWLVLEWVDGGELGAAVQERLRDAGKVDLAWTLQLFCDLAEALCEAHRQGVLHRDLKPGNILLRISENEPDRALLADFGLARFLNSSSSAESLTRTGESLGTLGFMSPEQVDAKGDFGPMTEATDVWGLGATLYFALTSHAPFEAPTTLEVMVAILTRPAQAPSELTPIPRWLNSLILSSLQKPPQLRPTMKDFARQLQAGSSELEAPSPASPRQAALRWTLLGMPLLLAGLLLAWLLIREPPRLIGALDAQRWSRRSSERLRGRLNRGGLACQINGRSIVSDSEGRFETDLPLVPGENRFVLLCAGQSLAELVIESDREPPSLEVNGAPVSSERLEWRADSEGYVRAQLRDRSPLSVTVLDAAVPLSDSGELHFLVPEAAQPRSIELIARDAAGNESRWESLLWSRRAQEFQNKDLAKSWGFSRFKDRLRSAALEALLDLSTWQAASSDVKEQLSLDLATRLKGFQGLGLESFDCADQKNEMLVFRHQKTGLRFILIPGALVEESYYSDPLGGMESEFLSLLSEDPNLLILRSLLTMNRIPSFEGDLLESLKSDRSLGPSLSQIGARREDRLAAAEDAMSVLWAFPNTSNSGLAAELREWLERRRAKLKSVEKRQIWRYVEPFLISDSELTIRDWKLVMGPAESRDSAPGLLENPKARDETPVLLTLPASKKWLNALEMRLPTISEWQTRLPSRLQVSLLLWRGARERKPLRLRQ